METTSGRGGSLALFGAIGGAILGALIWGGIAWMSHYEVGWVAWGIGLLVGGGAVLLGGRGPVMAGTAAALAVVSILGGKLLGVQFVLTGELESFATTQLTAEMHTESRRDWNDFAALPAPVNDDDIRVYMVQHGFTEEQPPESIADEEVAFFRAETVPWLREMAATDPTLEEWRQQAVAEMREEIPLMSAVTESLGVLDLLFAFLGVSTAYGMVMGATRNEATVPVRTDTGPPPGYPGR